MRMLNFIDTVDLPNKKLGIGNNRNGIIRFNTLTYKIKADKKRQIFSLIICFSTQKETFFDHQNIILKKIHSPTSGTRIITRSPINKKHPMMFYSLFFLCLLRKKIELLHH